MRIVLLGPPGSGKTNISNRIGEYCDVPVVTCSGVITRAAAEDSELGRLAKEAVDTNRVSDELLLALLRVRLSQKEMGNGFVLVDFPRNVGQADVVEGILDSLGRPLDLVLFVAVDGDELMERLVGRIACDHCGAKYNLYVNPPMVEGICDHCGARVNRRPDDYEETISNRLRIYDGLMGPLSQYYQLHGKLRRVDGNGGSDDVWNLVKKIIDATPRTVVETEPVSEPAVPINAAHDERGEAGVTQPPSRSAAPTAKETRPRKATKTKVAQAEPAAEKTPSRKAAAKKKTPTQVPAKRGKTQAGPASASKTDPKKQKTQAEKSTVAKKAPAKKRPVAKALVVKKAAAKKAAAKKMAVKKTTAKKATSKKSVTKKATVKKTAAKKFATKKIEPRKAVAKKTVAEKSGKKSRAKPPTPAKQKAAQKKSLATTKPSPRPSAKSSKSGSSAGKKKLASASKKRKK